MWLYRIFVTLCVIKVVYLAATSTPSADSNEKIPPSVNNSNLNEDEDDYYMPASDWSDTFDWKLLKAVSANERRNVLISPLSLKLALVMLYEGSEGQTEKQFQSILQFPERAEIKAKYKSILKHLQKHSTEHTLKIGTRLFLESSITPIQKYAGTIKDVYDTEIHPTNFSDSINASNSINLWIETITAGHIKNLVSADDLAEDVLLLVGNAIYFKGSWLEKFPVDNNHWSGFYVTPTEVVKVPYMSTTGKYFAAESKAFDAKILRLPYKGNQFAMYFVLPNTKGGLPDLLDIINLVSLKRQLQFMDNRTVDIVIPKFKFEYATSFTKILQDMGLTNMFSNSASFPLIARGVGYGTKFLFVNDIKQKAGVEVNEEGSEIYVATDIELGSKFGDADIIFNATHPFLIFVEERKTGSIVFAGKVENPLQTDFVPLPSRFGESVNESSQSATPAPVSSGSAQRPNQNPPTSQDRFDLQLLKAFDGNRNYFLSPASIKVSLAMLLEGAKHQTAQELMTALGLTSSSARQAFRSLLEDLNADTTAAHVESANVAFISKTLQVNREYQENLKKYYDTDITRVDYSDSVGTANSINNWVRSKTHGEIKDIVSPDTFSSGAGLVLANALYFKGLWKIVFDEKSTSLKCFRNHRKNCITTKTMQTADTFNYKFINALDAQALQLQYGTQDVKYAMLILLPNQTQTIEGLIQAMQGHSFGSIVRQLESSEVFVNIPRFEIDFNADVSSILQYAGVRQVFGDNADLSGITQDEKLKVSKVIHKAKVEVNEQGTVAAAASAVNVVPLMGSSMPRFIADHPFLFFIYHVKSNNILFEGRFNEPLNAYDEIFKTPDSVQPVHQSASQRKVVQNQEAVPLSANSEPPIYYLVQTNTETGGSRTNPLQSSPVGRDRSSSRANFNHS
ncbi:hypothetical protein ILUMI_21290 [Ignelater luminosus]|uniref:Serpin domain-containing protein n=1 Tax=Ignelater luminosus TaxID=2038154 RepID=A0A8K0CFU8_IGNLU|nr:hypothetical protein ILUMI_21290 [Ignelater luminosus]